MLMQIDNIKQLLTSYELLSDNIAVLINLNFTVIQSCPAMEIHQNN